MEDDICVCVYRAARELPVYARCKHRFHMECIINVVQYDLVVPSADR